MKELDKITGILKSVNKISFAYLFGSRAANTPGFGSAMDIAIYFTDESDLMEIGSLCAQLEEATGIEIDLVKLNLLFQSNPELAFNIINEGVLIFANNKVIVEKYISDTILYYHDFKPLRDKFHGLFLKRLNENNFAVK